MVLATQVDGALVALKEGLTSGFVPGLALESRPYSVAGRTLDFRVIGPPEEPDRDLGRAALARAALARTRVRAAGPEPLHEPPERPTNGPAR